MSTDLRVMTPGATRSTGRVAVAAIGPLSSIGRPSASTTRPMSAGADGHLDDRAGRLDGVAFLDARVVAEDDRADRLLLEVEREALDPVGELEQLGRERVLQPVDAGDAVADLDDRADRAGLDARRRTTRSPT